MVFIHNLTLSSTTSILYQDGNTPLWLVSADGRTELVQLFLQHGAEVDLPTDVSDDFILCTLCLGVPKSSHDDNTSDTHRMNMVTLP